MNREEFSALFLSYQTELMATTATEAVTVAEKSRRIGYSWAASYRAALTAAAGADAGGMDVFYVGYNLEMAREFIDYCAEHLKQIDGIVATVQESVFRDPDNPDKDCKVFRIDLASGFKILALPSVPRALRGMQGLVIIDEAAFHDDLEELLKAALALLMWGGRVLVISTHDGDTNPFNKLVQDIRAGRKPYKLLRVTFDDALEAGLYRKICERKGEEWTAEKEAAWRQEIIDAYGDAADEELFCIPSPSTGSAIPLALIEAREVRGTPVVRWAQKTEFTLLDEHVRKSEALRFCETELLPLLEALDPKVAHALGQDFARNGDLSVIWPLAIERSLLRRTPFIVELHNIPFDQQRQILWYIIDRLPCFRAGKLDARGNGQWLAEVTVQKYGSRIEAVMLSEAWYRDNMPPFKAAFEDGNITVPADSGVQDDIRSLKIVRGVIRVPEQRVTQKGGAKRHGDAAIAGALAYAASRADPEEYGYQAAPRNSTTTDHDPDSPADDAPDDDDMGIGMRGSVDF
ncbi:hypothetical protein [Komagataeibacter oboediens]|uniref:Mu-like prophage FluMu protein gp28 n=1 Tax=Komagataeibacter oboediens TaxID=65958 RepID=A0ABS5SR07_9PROT|nr:hypothetical protein [Komagataeibacter oboediens]MBL7232066.1 hypothetical protein [Komagataeibacter oboediens]MBT0676611.1 hypothetical protein [Komagataeibacter oboediens]MBT0679952.1 hypothetical protein [Komagataeibacter oboediens]